MSVMAWPDNWPEDARNVCAEWMAKYGEARDALDQLVDWEDYDAEYADDELQVVHKSDFAYARNVLAKHPRPYLDTGGMWTT